MKTTLREAIKKTTDKWIIFDGRAYKVTDIIFQEAELDTELDVSTVQNPNTFEKDYGKISHVAQGMINNHRIIISF